jgi:hypothetical protein
MNFPWGAIASFLYTIADWLWKRHEVREQAERGPLTNEEELDDIDKLPG